MARTKTKTRKKSGTRGRATRSGSSGKSAGRRRTADSQWQPRSASTHEVEWFLEYYRLH